MRLQVFLRTVFRASVLFALSIILVGSASAALQKKVLHIFENRPAANPASNLIFDASGNIYGSTTAGGSQICDGGCGTVFRLSPLAGGGWTYHVLYEFQGKDDGGYPVGNIVFDQAGSLYGVGGYGYGNVFKLTRQPNNTWTETTIYAFTGVPDASQPNSGLTMDSKGNLYGTTLDGGINGVGAVYELTPKSGGGWSESVLHSFSGADGEYPWAGVRLDSGGNVYGTTEAGGNFGVCDYGCGVVFELTPNGQGGWVESVLYAFTGGKNHGNPATGVLFDSSGNIYGTTSDNGNHGRGGSVFELTKGSNGTWTETMLHAFGRAGDGYFPLSDLVPDAAGNLYGSTYVGGKFGKGVIYVLKQNSENKWIESVFLNLNFSDGASPSSNPVTFDAAGDMFLATQYGGVNAGYDGYGVVLEITP